MDTQMLVFSCLQYCSCTRVLHLTYVQIGKWLWIICSEFFLEIYLLLLESQIYKEKEK